MHSWLTLGRRLGLCWGQGINRARRFLGMPDTGSGPRAEARRNNRDVSVFLVRLSATFKSADLTRGTQP
jgi:hypothetical protein